MFLEDEREATGIQKKKPSLLLLDPKSQVPMDPKTI